MNEAVLCRPAIGRLEQDLDDTASLGENKARRFKLNKQKPIQKTRMLILDENNNNSNDVDVDELRIQKPITVPRAIKFKYAENAPKAEMEEIRRLLKEQLYQRQDTFTADELEFVKCDFERMLLDDWLVTRFLIRGKKMAVLSNNQEINPANVDLRKQCFAKTMELVRICARFRYEYQINGETKLNEFPYEWTKVNGMFHHRHDRMGNPTAYLRVALHRPKLIETETLRHQFKRFMLYVLEQCDKDLFQKPGKAICCVFDMSQAAFENIDLELTTWMIKSFKNCAPKLLCYVIVYNPPWFFTATFRLICNTLLSNNKRQSIKFACGNEILDYIDYIDLPPYLKSTLM